MVSSRARQSTKPASEKQIKARARNDCIRTLHAIYGMAERVERVIERNRIEAEPGTNASLRCMKQMCEVVLHRLGAKTVTEKRNEFKMEIARDFSS